MAAVILSVLRIVRKVTFWQNLQRRGIRSRAGPILYCLLYLFLGQASVRKQSEAEGSHR